MKKYIAGVLLMISVYPAHAGTQATNLAAQMGGIAGIADACGQDINKLDRRVTQAIKIIANDPGDAENAMRAYDLAYRANFNAQVSVKIVPCKQALQTYADLPLLKNDYATALIAKKKQLDSTSYQIKQK